MNCTYRDLEPILTKKLKAKSCVIDYTKKYGCTNAIVHVDEPDFDQNKYVSWNIFKTKIFCTILAHNTPTCGGCGTPTHNIDKCNNVQPSRNGHGFYFRNTVRIIRNNGLKQINNSLSRPNLTLKKDQMDTTDNNVKSAEFNKFNRLCALFNSTTSINFLNSPTHPNNSSKNHNYKKVEFDNQSNTSSTTVKSINSKTNKSKKKQKSFQNTSSNKTTTPFISSSNSNDNKPSNSYQPDDKDNLIKKLTEENNALKNHIKELTNKQTILEKSIIEHKDALSSLKIFVQNNSANILNEMDKKIYEFVHHDLETKVREIIQNERHDKFYPSEHINKNFSRFQEPFRFNPINNSNNNQASGSNFNPYALDQFYNNQQFDESQSNVDDQKSVTSQITDHPIPTNESNSVIDENPHDNNEYSMMGYIGRQTRSMTKRFGLNNNF